MSVFVKQKPALTWSQIEFSGKVDIISLDAAKLGEMKSRPFATVWGRCERSDGAFIECGSDSDIVDVLSFARPFELPELLCIAAHRIEGRIAETQRRIAAEEAAR